MLRISFLTLAYTLVAYSAEMVPPPVSDDVGRFVFKQVGAADGSMYMIDTKTGRLWQIRTLKGQGYRDFLVPIKYFNPDSKMVIPCPIDVGIKEVNSLEKLLGIHSVIKNEFLTGIDLSNAGSSGK